MDKKSTFSITSFKFCCIEASNIFYHLSSFLLVSVWWSACVQFHAQSEYSFSIMVCRLFYASSACIYPEFKQLETNVSLKESDAWPAEVFFTFY